MAKRTLAECNTATWSRYAPGNLRRTAADVASGRLTCVEVIERCLARSAEVEGDIKAMLHLDSTGALERAASADRERRTGRGDPLDGIAVVVKDIIDVAGMPTTAGSRVPEPRTAAQDAEIVGRLRSAGAIVIGKANTHEFAFGATTPPTRNPVDTRRIAGGSSGGSAAAVAAGMALLGVGTDTGGSVRLPAALCGVAGFRPRANSIGMRGIVPLAPEFDAWGLLAPSAADLELVWSALRIESELVPEDVPQFIIPRHLSATIPEIDSDVSRLFSTAVLSGRSSGMRMVEADVADLREWQAPRMAIQMQQALKTHRDCGWWPHRRDFYSDEVRINFEIAERNADASLDDARARLSELDRAIDTLLSDGAVLCLPTVPVVAPEVAEVVQMPRNNGQRHPIVGLLARCTLPFSRSTLASLTIPCGTTSDALPVGLQLVATAEAALLRAGRLLENAIAANTASGRR